MKRTALFLISICIFLFSCQKEISWEAGVVGGLPGDTDTIPNTNGALLVKTVMIQNNQSAPTTYSYTADGKIEVINTMDTSGNMSSDYRRFYRDATGRIIRIAEKIPPQDGIETDTVYTNVHYPNATTFNYDYTIQKFSVDGFDVYDSISYTYNSNNQITESNTHQDNPILGPAEDIKIVYSYDAAGNLAKIEMYENFTGTMQLTTTFNMEYDDKPNPLGFDKQELLISKDGMGFSKNNISLFTFTDVEGNGEPQVMNYVYTYGSNGMPSKVVVTDQSGTNPVTTTIFYYQ